MKHSSPPLRWGIIAPGRIAHDFATGLEAAPSARLTAVASRNLERAQAFKEKFNADVAYASYEELVASGDVDAVYVASPHHLHMKQARLCLEAGKPVLCEKPLGINSRQVADLIELAAQKEVFLMEAMWTRFLPAVRKAKEWIMAGRIGTPRLMRGQFCFNLPYDPQSRIYNPELAGGSLLDVGIYPIALANMIFGAEVTSNQSVYLPAETGVDSISSGVLQFQSGAIAQWTAAVGLKTDHSAYIYGDEGYLHLPEFWHCSRLELNCPDKEMEVLDLPIQGNGYNYQAEEVANCLRAGKTQSDIMPLQDTLDIHKIMDQAREQWGLKYPME